MASNFRRRLLLAKLENTYAAAAPTFVATDAHLVTNLDVTPLDGEIIDLEYVLPSLGNRQKITGQRLFRLSFGHYLTVSNALGTAPKWAKFLVSSNFAQTGTAATDVILKPATKPGANNSSIAFSVNVDGRLHIGRGGRSNATFVLEAGQPPRIDFEYICLFDTPSDVAQLAPDLTGYDPDPVIVNSQNTTGVTIATDSTPLALCMESFNLNMNNVMPARQLAGCTEQVMLTGREPNGEMVVEAPMLAAYNGFVESIDQTPREIKFTHKGSSTQVIEFKMPNVCVENPTYTESDEIIMLTLPIYPRPGLSGNDEIEITIKAPA